MALTVLGSLRHSQAGLVLLAWLVLVPLLRHPADAAIIYVEGACTLAKAITAANTDLTDGDCVSGAGRDVIELTGNVTLTAIDNTEKGEGGPNGLPVVISTITIEGRGWGIDRGIGAPKFRILHVNSLGNLTLRNVSILNGYFEAEAPYSGFGGGILNDGTLTLVDATVSGNHVVANGGLAQGGGIRNNGDLWVTSSTINFNSATNGSTAVGGGISSSGTATISNSTISGNTASSANHFGYGGGVALYGPSLIQSSTLSGNAAVGAAGGVGAAIAAQIWTTVAGSVITNSLVAENCWVPGGLVLADGGGNQASDDSCGTIPDTFSGLDVVLRDNGGPTMTHALLEGSTAIGAAGTCGLVTDQRGAPRGASCDSGAFEYGGCPEIELSHDAVWGAEVYESCRISVGPSYAVVGSGGDLTLRGGREIVFYDGFSVEVDGALTAEIDGDLVP